MSREACMTRYERKTKRTVMPRYCRGMVMVAFLVAGFAGCGNPEKKVQEQAKYEKEFYQPFMQASAIPDKQVELPDYHLNVGDQLEIIFHVKHIPWEEYRFHTEDIINIRFPYHRDFNQTVTILPDGKIRLLLLPDAVDTYEKKTTKDGQEGQVGKTVGALQKELFGKYSKFFKNAELTVSFQAANIKIEELKKAITTAPRGQSRLMPVKPDGKITLPFLSDTMAYGKTIEELKADLNRKYEEVGIPELEVTVQILQVSPRRIYVMGEVARPGVLEVNNMITLSQALSMAGGIIPRADDQKVLVVRRKNLPNPEGVIVDVKRMLSATVTDNGVARPDTRKWTRDFWLDDYDVVYVPKSGLTKMNDWVEQVFTKGIYGVMPFSTSVGVNFGYQMYNAPYSVKSNDNSQWAGVANSIINQAVK